MNICKGNILSMTTEDLTVLMSKEGFPSYRGGQIFSWLHRNRAEGFEEMTNLPENLRDKLESGYEIFLPEIEEKLESSDGTVKYLFRLSDGNLIESVFMRYYHGNTLCVSSQVGCRMGCRFCASTKEGLVRNLSAGEIIGQVYAAAADMEARVNNVVLMGVGEPLDNYENVIKFIEIITNPTGYRMSVRNISLSTCGLVPMIDELAKKKLGITLSVSLHSAIDEKRSKIMPVNKKYNLDSLISSCRNYHNTTGRRVSFEYAMISGENDKKKDTEALAKLLKGMNAHINLIPVNRVDGTGFSPSEEENIASFQKMLTDLNLNATVRRRLGLDIDAACGQLRANRDARRKTLSK